jgi:hypothetical protein
MFWREVAICSPNLMIEAVSSKPGLVAILLWREEPQMHPWIEFGCKAHRRQLETSTMVSTGSAPPRMRISRTG